MFNLELSTVEQAIEYIEGWGHETLFLGDRVKVFWMGAPPQVLSNDEVIEVAKEIYRQNEGE